MKKLNDMKSRTIFCSSREKKRFRTQAERQEYNISIIFYTKSVSEQEGISDARLTIGRRPNVAPGLRVPQSQ